MKYKLKYLNLKQNDKIHKQIGGGDARAEQFKEQNDKLKKKLESEYIKITEEMIPKLEVGTKIYKYSDLSGLNQPKPDVIMEVMITKIDTNYHYISYGSSLQQDNLINDYYIKKDKIIVHTYNGIDYEVEIINDKILLRLNDMELVEGNNYTINDKPYNSITINFGLKIIKGNKGTGNIEFNIINFLEITSVCQGACSKDN